jgi:Zn-dependent peptidase ImmA (M78 family)/transcriptional regulator with XRE-family HTH domain
MATELAPVTPDVLRWARESIGVSLEAAAKRAGVTAERLQGWEAGTAEPTVAKLRDLAKLYQRPLAVFFLPEPPQDFDVPHDFRRLPGTEDHTWSRSLHKVYRRAVEQQEIAAELLEAEGEPSRVDLPGLELGQDTEEASVVARMALGVSLSEQYAWRKPVEDLGVLVLRTSEVSFKEMRGFSIYSENPPVIVVNALDWPRGQVFTLIHEFVHLLLREAGVCDLLEPSSGHDRRVEAFCNAVAAAVLIPAQALDEGAIGPRVEREWEDDVLAQLSARFGVSQEAVLRRLVTLKRATMEFYLAKREEYLAAYDESREDEKAKRKDSPGGPPPYRMAVRDRGKPYVRLVLDAYQREAISPSSLSRLLGLKLKHVAALEREVR